MVALAAPGGGTDRLPLVGFVGYLNISSIPPVPSMNRQSTLRDLSAGDDAFRRILITLWFDISPPLLGLSYSAASPTSHQ